MKLTNEKHMPSDNLVWNLLVLPKTYLFCGLLSSL